MAHSKITEELDYFNKYLRSDDNEDARRPLLYPLFKKLFGDKMKIESAACGADVYINGQLIVEAKSDFGDWLEGFYQALHYQKKYGLSYHTIMVVAREFVGIWKLNKLPEYVTILSKTSDPHKAPNEIGKINARKTAAHIRREIQLAAYYWLTPKDLLDDIFGSAKSLTIECFAIKKILSNINSERQQIGIHNFINCIERMKPMFPTPIEAVHAFYSIIYFWDITSKVISNETGDEVRVLGYNGNKFSEVVNIHPHKVEDFKRFVEGEYIFTNEGSGLTVDYYFSRFDEVLSEIDPDYVKQHGIFFTDANLSKFSLWFAREHFPGNIHEDYIVFDPAAGSGNLVSSWRGKLKHKIVSELEPDLLSTIERRMQADPFHTESGFTIIPKTSEGIGLNFLDKDAATYMEILQQETRLKNINIDKPICFLLNPPYKNTDENQKERDKTNASYSIHESIIQHTGEDAGKERYLAFLSQIMNIADYEFLQNQTYSVVMIFTPTSWLIPRPTYTNFRNIWDRRFKFHSGFIVTSNEFFKLKGKWPLAFTIWIYDPNNVKNDIRLYDLTEWGKENLNNIPWENTEKESKIDNQLNKAVNQARIIEMNKKRVPIKTSLNQKMYDFKRDATKLELDSSDIYGGLPLRDLRRNNKKTYGVAISPFIGFMDDSTPCRIKNDGENRMSNLPDRVWLQLRPGFIDINLTKVQSGAPDKYGYCAFDLESAKSTFSWFCLTKVLNGQYPIWANQYDIWTPNIKESLKNKWYALCAAFVLSENRCVVTKFERDNPVAGAPEIFIDNPLCPTNKSSFWSTVIQPFINQQTKSTKHGSIQLIEQITELYRFWNHNYCKGQFLYNCGLHGEPYFQYFNYPDFLTPYSGLTQIEKYAQLHGDMELLNRFSEIGSLVKSVRNQLYKTLIDEFEYFK